MARNRNQQRIDEPILRPTQNLTDNFVPAHSAAQINMEGAAAADWTEGFQNLLMAGEKAVTAHRKAEDKLLAEAGEAIWADVQTGMTLDKAVAKYTSTGTTPQGLRKKLRKWTEGGEMSKSANPFFVRSYEEGKNKQTATLFESLLASEMQELVAAGKAVAGPGRQKEMLEAITSKAAEYMSDDLFDGLSAYGAGHLRGMLVESGNRLSGLALARAEDEMTAEAVDSHVNTWLDTAEKSIDHANAMSILTGGRVFSDPDVTLKNINQSLSSLNDSISDLVSPDQASEAMEDGVMLMMQRVVAKDLDPDSAIEHIQKIADESSRTRENGGTGPKVFGAAGSAKILSKAQSHIHNIERNRDRSDADYQKGMEFHVANADKYSWSRKRLEDLTDDERAEKNEYIKNVFATRGAGYARGVLQMIDYNHKTAGPSGGTASREEENLIVGLKSDPRGALPADAPIGFTHPDIISNWTLGTSDTPEVQDAMRDALGTVTKELRSHATRLDTNFESFLHNIVNTKEQISFAELGDDAQTPAPSGIVEARLREDPELQRQKNSILSQLRHGEIEPEVAYAQLQTAIRSAWIADGDTLKTLEDQKIQNAEARAEALRSYAASQPDAEGETAATAFVGYGPEYFIDRPKHPYKYDSGSAITNWLTMEPPKSVGIWTWKGPGTQTLEEWGKEAVDAMMLTNEIPVLSQVERVLTGTPKATGEGPLNMVKRGEQTALWLDGAVAEAVVAQSPHDDSWMSLDEEFYDDLLTDFARAQMPDGLIPAATYGTLEFLLGEDMVTKQWKADLLNHGTPEEFVKSYLGIAKTIGVDANGEPTVAVGPEGIPSWSVIGMPGTIYEDELVSDKLYPEEGRTSPALAKRAYETDRKLLSNHESFLLSPLNAQEQRIRMDIHDRVQGNPLLERHWETTKKVYTRFYGPYNHASETARAQISHIWRHLAQSEQARKVQLDG